VPSLQGVTPQQRALAAWRRGGRGARAIRMCARGRAAGRHIRSCCSCTPPLSILAQQGHRRETRREHRKSQPHSHL
jgi:hypothetical protein